MEKNTIKNLIALTVVGFYSVMYVTAQGVYQLPNPDFEQWEKGVKLNGNVTSVDEPVGWNSFGTATGNLIYIAFTSSSITKGNDDVNHYAIITSRLAVGISANGTMTTGIINVGATTANSKDNHNYTVPSTSTSAGADNFRQRFTGHPDAFTVKTKYIPGAEATTDNAKAAFQAGITAWIHKDTGSDKFQSPYETSIESKAVALAEVNPQYDNAREWTTFVAEFDYSIGNEGNVPAYILITAGTNTTPGGGSSNDSLFIDDLYFIYYSTLSDLMINGTSIEGFDESITEYNMSGTAPEVSAVTATAKSRWASLEDITRTVEDGKTVITVTIKGNDFEVSGNQTVYKLRYEQDEPVEVEPIVGDYRGRLTMQDAELSPSSVINLTKDAEGMIGLHLKDFFFGDTNVGDIDIPDIPVSYDSETYRFESGLVDLSLMGGLILANVKADGTVTGNNITINILVVVGEGEDAVVLPIVFEGTKSTLSTNSTMPDNIRIQVSGTTISVEGFSGLLQAYNTTGMLVYSQSVDNTAVFSLEKGLYIIRMGDKAIKILVK